MADRSDQAKPNVRRPDEFDVAVIGAGPAGSIAAYAAARRGLRVALVDQRTFPRDKACGDGLGPGVAELLGELDLGHVLAGAVPARALTVYGPDDVILDTDLPPMHGHGYVVPRLDLDDRLHTAALGQGAVDLAGHKLVETGLTTGGNGGDGEHRWARLRGKGADVTIRASVLVGADGAYSAVRRQLGVPKNPEQHLAIAMRAYAKSTAFDERPCLVFEFSRALLPAYGWIFPTGAGLLNVGVGLMLPHLRRRNGDLRYLLDKFIIACRERGIEIGEPYGHRAHHLPTAAWLPPLAHERAVLIGDAASMINPVSGEGIVYGMRAGRRLADALPADLTDANAVRRALRRFEREFRRSHRAHLYSSRAAHRLLSSPWWTKRVIHAAQRDPQVLRGAIDLLFDIGRLHPSTTFRILRHGW